MSKLEVQIESPCHEDWDAMPSLDGGRRRFCEQCDHQVHDLSEMSRDEAEAFLARTQGQPICIAYSSDEHGELLHRAPSVARLVPLSRLSRRRVPLAGAAALLTGALAACAPHGEAEQMPELDPVEETGQSLAPRVEVSTVPAALPDPPEAPAEIPAVADEPCVAEVVKTHKRKGKRVIRKTKGMKLAHVGDPLSTFSD